MKYVVLQERCTLGLRCVVFGTSPLTHGELAAAFSRSYRPVSAGFCEPLNDCSGRWRTFGHSDSLNLGPAAGDAPLIEVFARHTASDGRAFHPAA